MRTSTWTWASPRPALCLHSSCRTYTAISTRSTPSWRRWWAGFRKELAQIWVTLRLLNRYLGDVETSIINFSMKEARDHAWSAAQRVAPLDDTAQEAEIAQLDSEVLRLAHLLRHPGVVGGLVTKTVRAGERGTIPRIIDILS